MHINHFSLRLGLVLGAVLIVVQTPPGQAQEASGSQSDTTGAIITTGDTAAVGQPGAVINIAPIVTSAVSDTVPTVTSSLAAVVNGTGTLSTTVGGTTITVDPEVAPVVFALVTGETITPSSGTTITLAQAASTVVSNLDALPNVAPEQAQTLANALQGLLAPGTPVNLENLATAVNTFNAVATTAGPSALSDPTLVAIRAVLAPLVDSFYVAVEE